MPRPTDFDSGESACIAAPVPSAVLGEPGTSPQPPSSFWTSCSQESDFARPPLAPAVRRAITAKAVLPGQPSKEPLSGGVGGCGPAPPHPHLRPAGHLGTGIVARGGAEAAVAVLRRDQPLGG